jgi:TonB family protein
MAQTPNPSDPSVTSEASNEPVEPTKPLDPMQVRLARARALAAAHNLPAAATELDAIISATTDDMVRDVSRIMLMGIYLEEAEYTRADALLVQTYQTRSTNNESSQRSYFALAGQTINGARSHLERYRSYGINVADKELPPDALNDIERLRLLLERVADQAREISNSNLKGSDATALLEDVVSVRRSLARDAQDRTRWQNEFASARERLADTETRMASGGVTARRSSNAIAPSSGALKSGGATTNISANQSSTAERIAANSATGAALTPPATSTEQVPAPSRSNASASAQGASNAHNSEPMNVGSLVEKATQKVSPYYPPVAKSAGVQGLVTINLEVDEKGTVIAVRNMSGPQMLRQAATSAAWRWKFKPTLVEGQPVRVTGYINFNFTL